jgi:hypothetical protein
MKQDEVFCIKCGEKVTVRATDDSKYLADCGHGSRCGWAFGATEEEALANYSENQRWGMDRLNEFPQLVEDAVGKEWRQK